MRGACRGKMRKVIETIHRNKLIVISCFVLGQIVAFLVPAFLNIQWVKRILSIQSFNTILSYLPFTTIFVILFLSTYKPAANFWRRYKNNYTLKEPLFTYVDGIAIFLLSWLFFSLVFRERLFRDIVFSKLSLWMITVFGIFGFIWFGCTYLSLFISEKKKNKIKETMSKKDSPYFSDEPIIDKSQDILGRSSFVDALYKEITELPFSDSFVFGLYGKWGEGKTSVVNLLKNKLVKNSKVIFIDFDPWYFRDQESLLKNFYRNIEMAMNKMYFFPHLKRSFNEYQENMTVGLRHFGIGMGLSFRRKDKRIRNIKNMKEQIEADIQKTGKKLVICIDDIDRMQSEEMLLIFNTVKLSANFKNTIFVLSFDPEIITKSIKDRGGIDFLDKIVQKTIPLPKIEQSDIDKFLLYSDPETGYKSAIDNLFDKLNIEKKRIQKFDEDFIYLYESQIKNLLRTLRHAKRYTNGLYSTLPPIKSEINLYDFFILEAIRIFYPAVYNDIWKYPWYYIPPWDIETQLLASPLPLKADLRNKQIKQHIEELVVNEPNKDITLELLKNIFFVVVKNALENENISYDTMAKTYRTEERITHPACFPKYFMFKIPSGELSDELIDSTIKSLNSSDESDLPEMLKNTYMRFQKAGKLSEFFKKLLLFSDKIDTRIARPVIQSLYKNIGIFSRKEVGGYRNSEYDKAESLVLQLINDKTDKSEIQSIIEEVIEHVEMLEFTTEFVLFCKKERGDLHNIYKNIDIKRLKRIVSDRLEAHLVKNNRDIFKEYEEKDWGFILYQWGTNWTSFDGENREKVNDYVFGLIDEHPEYLGKIIRHFVQQSGTREEEIDYDSLMQLYDVDIFYSMVKEPKGRIYSNDEEREAVNLFAKVYKKKLSSGRTK